MPRVQVATRDDVVAAIEELSIAHGYPPSVRELGARLGYRTPDMVHYHLEKLRDEGRVTWVDGKARTLRVVT